MASAQTKQLHWTQRIALVRHNLHAASRSGDFTFFKTLQATGLMEGTNHFATLAELMGDDADVVMAAMDNLNGGLAYIHQDAFQKVYDNLRNATRDDDKQAEKSKLYVDISQQKQMTEMAIDKLCNSAVALIHQQAPNVRDQVANVFITGVTLVADCVEVVIQQLDLMDNKMDDFIRLEESWNIVKASIIAATAGLKGVFYMLDTNDQQGEKPQRSSSIASAGSGVFRRLSTVFTSAAPASSRSSSIASAGAPQSRGSIGGGSSAPVYRTPTYVRNSVSAGCPTSIPSAINNSAFSSNFEAHKLSTIPPTPAFDEDLDPFDKVDMPPVPAMPMEHEANRIVQTVM
ncbi:uncharacterized protein MYCFIDRAFT_85335 [Pseudocercospora fijiensis CIRAD86]|uniref:Uncharacterized protein n=1 Tax=Pseudocercospora fijiensis (strain CIRAD86) TaxID=383855 RepID=M3AI99_PSEFD|nr:uncharacterized protein MYCFIDRAFT_85335 [Pseudocercospora fijiensis CIRAD86]EME76933.1 hypothetical protein MYCFIDRAFT_85335 [Pseudocercospora fijiensis CIRAD86]